MDQDATWYGGRPRPKRHCVGSGPSYSLPDKGAEPPLIFGPFLLWPNGYIHQDAIWYGGRPQSMPHFARWDPAHPPQKGGTAPNFGPCLLWPNGWMDQDATRYDGRPRPGQHCVKCGRSSTPMGHSPAPKLPNFGPCLHVVAKRLDGSRCHLVQGRPRPTPHCVTSGSSSPSQRGTALQFSAHVYCGQTVAHLSYC